MSDAFSVIPLRAVAILSSSCVTVRLNRKTIRRSLCLASEQNGQQQRQL